MASVKVAVRVRPFNQREIDLESNLIISMDGKKTKISNSKIAGVKDAGSKEFTFDHSYWSYDGDDPHFATQEQVFEDLGTEVVDSAFEGYNACVFAYGQTGSGKTFTMMGSPENQGLIPRICKSLFDRMHVRREEGASYRTEVSYLEIYNEKVKDLLQSNASHSLRVREHPSRGPYVESLSTHLVSDYPDIQEWMKRGNVLRTTARTNMNDTSSRSHAIFTITFVQAEFTHNNPIETVSKIHLVDLAGSERADATGATGERLKEGAHINKSLVTLGLVISSLAKMTVHDKRNSTFIPYRDSVLTWLLKDSLGGNSKTIMIAAISPADVNYEETLSTLRYANRAKNIINKPTVNEDPNVTLIRTLRDEINKLKSMMAGHVNHQEQSVLAQLHQKEAREKALTEEWTEKWRETKSILEEQSALGLRKSGVGIILDSDRPHLVGIDDDLLSTGVTFYHIKNGETLIGTEESSQKQDIELSGVGISPEHCSLILRDGQAWLHPKPNAACWVNNVAVVKPVRLSQGCIILLGRNNMFRFNHPAEAAALRKTGSISHLNNSNLSTVYSSTTDLAERTFSHENLLETSNGTLREIFHSSPKLRRTLSESEADANDSAQKFYSQELVDLEASYKAEKERLVADWKRLEEEHSQNVAHLSEKESALQEKRKVLEKAVEAESEKLNQITQELHQLEDKKAEHQKEFEAKLCEQMEQLRQTRHEGVASDVTSRLATATSPGELVQVLTNALALLPETAGQQKEELSRIISKYNDEMTETDMELSCHEKSLNNVQSLVTSLTSQLSALTSSSEGSEAMSLFSNSSSNLKDHKESFTLPLSNDGLYDSGLGSTLTNKALSDPRTPMSISPVGAIKRRIRGSDSSEEELAPGRPRARLVRHKQLSKSCRAIYDEVGIGEAMRAMNELCQKVAEQKLLIMQSLEDDCSKEEINVQIADLQNLHRQYVRLEAIIELRKENVLMKMQQNREIDLFSNLTLLNRQPPRVSTRSLPTLRQPSEDWPCWVQIPSFVLRGVGRQSRYEYEVRIRTEDESWVLMRRYNRFRELHVSMCAKYGPMVEALDFPPKKWLPFSRESLARKRRCLLENYLINLIDICSRIRGCPLFECSEFPTRRALLQFSPFFRKGLFEPGKYGTS